MRSQPLLGMSLIALLAAAACSSGSTPSAPPSTPTVTAGDLDGRTFVSTGSMGHDLVPDSQVTLTFEDGQIGGNAGCNLMTGGYEIADSALTVSQIAMTQMACDAPLMAQDTWIASFLDGSQVTLDGASLTLTKDGVSLALAEKIVADAPLEGTHWILDGIVDGATVSNVPEGVTAGVTFSDGKVVVETGCNNGNGRATIVGDKITFEPLATTRMACPEPQSQTEQKVTNALQGELTWSIKGDRLELRGASAGLDFTAAS